MAQPKIGLARRLILLPWWGNVLLALVAFLAVSQGVPWIYSSNPFTAVFEPVFMFLGAGFAGIFILAAILSILKKRR